MKKVLLSITLCLMMLPIMAQTEKYVINVVVHNPNEKIMEFNDWGNAEGKQVEIVTGKEFWFEGELAKGSYPRSASLSFVNGPSRRGNLIILEPGTIQVTFDAKGIMSVSGTPENENHDRINKVMREHQEASSSAFYNWQRAYNNKAPKEELEKWQVDVDKARAIDREFALKLIRKNNNYAGLMLLNRSARNETAKTLKPFMKQFKRFSESQPYKYMLSHYEAMTRCTDGAVVENFTLPNPEGKMVSLSDFKGKWVILDFWYVDCHWCRKLAPNLKEIYQKYSDKLEIISISVDPEKDHQRWIKAIEEDGMTWTQVNDKSKKLMPEYFGVSGYPTLFLIDPKGRGVTMMVGYRETGSLERTLNQYIK